MKNIDKYVAEKIKDGSYYDEAHKWYMHRFIHPITERYYLLIIAVFLLIILALSAINTSSTNDSDIRLPLPIKVSNSTDYFSVIKPLAKPNQTTQDAVARYFIIDYLKTREEYIPKEMQGNKFKYTIRKVKSSSSKKVLNEYQSYMNSMNPHSPIARYKDHTTRKIKLKSFEFADNDPLSGKATIRFTATTTTKNMAADKNNKSLWQATIHFKLADIETIAKTEAPLRFLVKYYRAKLVN